MAADLTIYIRIFMSMDEINIEQEERMEGEQELSSSEARTQQSDENTLTSKLSADLEEQKDKYIRLYAEFDNFKRRTAKERLELIQTAGADVIKSLLPVLDDFDRAEKSIEAATDIEAVKQGLLLIKEKLYKVLQQKGLQAMNTLGENFDAEWQEAITEIPAPNSALKGKVIDEVEKGYLLNDKIIRYAKVIVGK